MKLKWFSIFFVAGGIVTAIYGLPCTGAFFGGMGLLVLVGAVAAGEFDSIGD